MSNESNGYIVAYERVRLYKGEPAWVFKTLPFDSFDEASDFVYGLEQHEFATTRNIAIYKRV